MRKKLLTVAMAAIMVVSSAFSSFAVENVDHIEPTIAPTGFLTASTSPLELEGDFDLIYTFHNESNGTGNWNNFVIEVKTADDQADGVTFRADR